MIYTTPTQAQQSRSPFCLLSLLTSHQERGAGARSNCNQCNLRIRDLSRSRTPCNLTGGFKKMRRPMKALTFIANLRRFAVAGTLCSFYITLSALQSVQQFRV
jgi:hypothetical protein